MKLKISMEKEGKNIEVGTIIGNEPDDACFVYNQEYLANKDSVGISISLPLRNEPFSPAETKNFFEGLLPEGFTRKTVAAWLHKEENDYLQILEALGKECIGAIKVMDEKAYKDIPCKYEKLSMEQVHKLAQEGAERSAELVTKAHLSLTGASGKVGLYYDSGQGEWYLPVGSAPSTHIVKQSHVRLSDIVTNEQLSMLSAKKLGISVPDTFIVNTGGFSDGDVLFATERYDRIWSNNPSVAGGLRMPRRLHQEDFAQALGIGSSDKYEGAGKHYLHDMFNLLRMTSSNPIEDELRLWDMVVFNFFLGNTDAHLKNYSILYGEAFNIKRLAPAYDLISTTVYKSSTRDMSFRIGGHLSIDEINRDVFADAAGEIGLGRGIAMNRYDLIANQFEAALKSAEEELTSLGYKKAGYIREKILETGGYGKDL